MYQKGGVSGGASRVWFVKHGRVGFFSFLAEETVRPMRVDDTKNIGKKGRFVPRARRSVIVFVDKRGPRVRESVIAIRRSLLS